MQLNTKIGHATRFFHNLKYPLQNSGKMIVYYEIEAVPTCWKDYEEKKIISSTTWYYVPRWPNGINPLNYTNRGVPVKILSVDETASFEIEALAKVISLIKHFALPTIIKIDFLEEEICSALQNSEVKNEVETCNGQFNFQNLLKCSFIHFLVNQLIYYLYKIELHF